MTTTSFRPDTVQWRLMNKLSTGTLFTADRDADAMLRACASVAPFELCDLLDAELVSLTLDGKACPRIDASTRKIPHGADLRLMAAGHKWVADNPHNKALRFLGVAGSRWQPVRKVAAESGVGLEAVWELHAIYRYVEIADEYGASPANFDRLRSNVTAFKVALTRKGDSVLS